MHEKVENFSLEMGRAARDMTADGKIELQRLRRETSEGCFSEERSEEAVKVMQIC